MRLRHVAAVCALGTVLGAGAIAQSGPDGYLPAGSFDILQILPPAPVIGDARDRADRAIFRGTRKLVGTPRWQLATNDVKLSQADLMRDYSCAVGIALTPERAPRTAAVLSRATIDAARQSGAAKTFYKRRRPYLADRGATCQPPAELHNSYDYPSGHTTAGWTWATLLAELAPDRATQVLARGRAFGESRIVCGVHNASAVEAGRVTSAATMAALHGRSDFSRDLAAARREMDALRGDPATPRPDAALCAREAVLVTQRID